MIVIKIKADSISLKDMEAIAEGVKKIGTRLFERTDLFLEVGTVLVDDDSQNMSVAELQKELIKKFNQKA